MNFKEKISKHLKIIYKNQNIEEIKSRIFSLIPKKNGSKTGNNKWSEKDIILITYGNSVYDYDEPPLQTLKKFIDKNFSNEITCVHILPFFPYSADDGFSVIDYYAVDPSLGDWKDIKNITMNFDLMVDLVVNHVSKQSDWFKKFLDNEPPYDEFFIVPDSDSDLSKVVRPRNTPLLTPFETSAGEKHVWTTFSDDQIDLNFRNPRVLLEMIQILLFYIQQGTKIIRLDAIAFLWKEPGTTCLHLSETHEVVKLFRTIAEAVNPSVIILTETNVPNKENLSYFGNNDEAHLVYQFSLPPLMLHALNTGNTKYLNDWLETIPELSPDCSFFNFTASHDGIGVRPLEGLLPLSEMTSLLADMKQFGGHVSMKSNPDGSQSPYEINITYFDALKGTCKGIDNLQVERFICSQTIMLSMKGIPAFYIHSLIGTENYIEGVNETGRARTINRKNWNEKELNQLLTTECHHSKILNELKRRIQIRKQLKAFHPDAGLSTVRLQQPGVLCLRRGYRDDDIIVLVNAKNKPVDVNPAADLNLMNELYDHLENKKYLSTTDSIVIQPYQVMWLMVFG